MDTLAGTPVEISEWKPAPFELEGETVFAIGDVHGCAEELRALLGTVGKLARESCNHKRLVYLGDMINRGPDSIGVLELWAANEAAHGVDHIDRLMGNHEIMMMLAVIGGPHAHKAETMWLSKRMGGQVLLDQMRARAGAPAAHPDQALLKTALGDLVVHRLYGMRAHVRLGNTLFVHGGLDPHADPDEFLARPWTIFTEARWAWINHGFLDWKGGFRRHPGRPRPHAARQAQGDQRPGRSAPVRRRSAGSRRRQRPHRHRHRSGDRGRPVPRPEGRQAVRDADILRGVGGRFFCRHVGIRSARSS